MRRTYIHIHSRTVPVSTIYTHARTHTLTNSLTRSLSLSLALALSLSHTHTHSTSEPKEVKTTRLHGQRNTMLALQQSIKADHLQRHLPPSRCDVCVHTHTPLGGVCGTRADTRGDARHGGALSTTCVQTCIAHERDERERACAHRGALPPPCLLPLLFSAPTPRGGTATGWSSPCTLGSSTSQTAPRARSSPPAS